MANLKQLFAKHENKELYEFDRISAKDRLSDRSDVHAMLLIDSRSLGQPGQELLNRTSVNAGQTVFMCDTSKMKLTESEVIQLLRCGVSLSREGRLYFVGQQFKPSK